MATALPAWVVAWYHVGPGWQMSGRGAVHQEGATICLRTSLFSGQQIAYHTLPLQMSFPLLGSVENKNDHHLSNTYWLSGFVQAFLFWFMLRVCGVGLVFPIYSEERLRENCPTHSYRKQQAGVKPGAQRPKPGPPLLATLFPKPREDSYSWSPRALSRSDTVFI